MSIVRMGRWLWDSETGEFFEPLIGAKGSVSTPPPSAEETALQRKQLELLNTQSLWARQQQEEQQALAPYLYAQMGMKRIEDPSRASSITDLTTKLQAERALLKKMGTPQGVQWEKGKPVRIREEGGTRRIFGAEDLSDKLGPAKHIFNPGGIFGGRDEVYRDFTPAEKKWAQQYNKVKSLGAQLKTIESTPIKYTFEKMSQDELRAQMSPEELQAADIRSLANERTLKALQGNLDVDPSVEADIQRGQAQLRQELLQKLGPGAEGSDSWNRAMSEFDRNMNALRYSVRHGEMTTSDAIATNRVGESMRRQEQALGNIHDSTRNYSVSAAALSGANQGMDSALSRFYGMRRDAAGIAQQNEASQGALVGAGIGGGVAIGGMALIAI